MTTPPTRSSSTVDAGAGAAGARSRVESQLADARRDAEVKARGYWELVWIRFRRDKLAIASGVFIIFLFLAAFVARADRRELLGHGPNDIFADGRRPEHAAPGRAVDARSRRRRTRVRSRRLRATRCFILGADGQLGRDLFLRLLYGAQTSLEVAVLATLLVDGRSASLHRARSPATSAAGSTRSSRA